MATSGRGGVEGDFNIAKFMSKVDNLGGIARKNRFSVEIIPPSSLRQTVDASTISFLAKTVSFPARSFGSTTYRSGGRFGLEVPYETTFEAVGITMLNTNDHSPRKFWTSWFNHIMKIDESGGLTNYNMQYYKKFTGTIKISHYSEDTMYAEPTQANYRVTLHDAWPKTLSAISVGWEDSELGQFDIDIAYSRWSEE